MNLDAVPAMNDNRAGGCVSEAPPELVDNAHINPYTHLATDFLNHFNEIVMLVEMLPEIPDVYADIVAWEPLTYIQHFEMCNFCYSDLAIRAYKTAPDSIRKEFDALISDIDMSIITGRQDIIDAFEKEDTSLLKIKAVKLADELRVMIDRASAIINGTHKSAQDQADSIFEGL